MAENDQMTYVNPNPPTGEVCEHETFTHVVGLEERRAAAAREHIRLLQDPTRWSGYDDGGVLPIGTKVTTGKPERVWALDQLERGSCWIRDQYGEQF